MRSIYWIYVSIIFFSCSKGKKGEDEPIPVASVSGVSLPEGNSGSTSFELTLKLSAAISKSVTVTYSTLDGTATAGEDYVAATNQPVVFQPGETEKRFTLSIVGDIMREDNETFTLMLTGATNATILQHTATITILNDDTKIQFTNAGYDAPDNYPGYTLAWADEFDGPALDPASWSNQDGDGCPNLCGWGNNELEYYTSRPQNLFFQDGKLVIEARKENFNGKSYTSSKILTAGKKYFRYGRIDIRAKLPKGKGIWPAFWMLPQNNVYGGWPTSGEIDIMEMVGHEPNRTHGTLHYGPGPGSTQYNRSTALPTGALHDEFHVYSIEWKEDQIKWFLDGNLFSTANKSDLAQNDIYPFNEEFYFIINLAVGGNWPGSPDATTSFPQHLIVDYIRVYQ